MKTNALLFILFASTNLLGQQVSDTLFTPKISRTTFPKGKGPLVLIDEAHHNFHTATGRFRPFALLLERDGFQVKPNVHAFTKASLRPASILVIANALNERNDTIWALPTPSAFSEDEIAAVEEWVRAGGSLFLIADHMPFPGCNEKLAAAFGVTFTNGFAMPRKGDGPDLFCYANGRLKKTVLTEGLDSIYSFTGQAFQTPPQAMVVLELDDQFENLLPTEAWEFDRNTKKESAVGLKQGAYFEYGKGKVYVSGEAAMFTAQIAQGTRKVGFNAPIAKYNATLLLNIVRWLGN